MAKRPLTYREKLDFISSFIQNLSSLPPEKLTQHQRDVCDIIYKLCTLEAPEECTVHLKTNNPAPHQLGIIRKYLRGFENYQ